ncbi:anti-sigma factor family protein [Janthinobacterium agaricidamnosum]|uniref:Putative transmembrane anti-sigma factor n=1 Tax=Janthinobacterium agaricidamnosum NBRC 102515 = DSM 9628 TaxID=1349767 RepID=W0V3M8_9BURK|nr:hypothetical protein [Janthinobacterium agaricidamnosum]CDG82466.1 putative transmembrane anti-sigma factor [Janthinobacterium agaricidamnosum NBRC 102515 = DSM 9628]
MIVDDNLLLAYANDSLSPGERDAVDTLLRHDAALANRVAAMQASRLPYQAAFAAQALPQMPQHLRERIMDMARISAAAPPAEEPAPAPRPAHARSRWPLLGALAAALMLGVGLHAASSAYWNSPEKIGWMTQVANYQSLYVRDTVQMVHADPAASHAVISNLYEKDHIRLAIPDMSAYGLQFKRVQRLGFNYRPLVQMVYLPSQGDPVALCVIPEKGPDVAPYTLKVRNMNMVSWRRGGLAYVLLTDTPQEQLAALGNLLYQDKLPGWLPSAAEAKNS